MFDCSKVKCEASCCGPVPFEKDFYKKTVKLKEVIKEHTTHEDGIDFIIPETADFSCPFLDMDFRCAIYNDRPQICRDFGNGKHPLLTCPYIEPSGKVRSKKNRKNLRRNNGYFGGHGSFLYGK